MKKKKIAPTSLSLSKQDIEKIYSHALDEYNEECCGIIIGPLSDNTANKVYRCTNIQNRLHRQDPAGYPRDARKAYYIAPEEFRDILKKTESNNLKIKAFYHSHPDHDVYFSEKDKKNALFFDTPAYPDVLYIVVSVIKKTIKEIGFFIWKEDAKDFVQIAKSAP